MQAVRLGKKYPEFQQEEIFDLINKFKLVSACLPIHMLVCGHHTEQIPAAEAFYTAPMPRGFRLAGFRCKR